MSVTATRSGDRTMPGSFGYAATTTARTTYNNDVYRPPPSSRSSPHTTHSRRKDLKSPRTISSNTSGQQRQPSRTSSYASATASSYQHSQPRWQSTTSDQASVHKRPRLDVYQRRPPSPRPSQRTPTHDSRSSTAFNSYFSSNGNASVSSLKPFPSHDSTAATSQYSDFDIASPSPLANTSYRLAGGLDTPTASYEKRLDDIAVCEAESDWRVDRFRRDDEHRNSTSESLTRRSDLEGRSASYVGEDGKFHRVSSPRTPSWDDGAVKSLKRGLDDSSNASTSPRSTGSKSISGWHIRSTAWALTGGLAAKAINFCVSAAFTGFKAGGGIAYKMRNGISVSGSDRVAGTNLPSEQDVFSSSYQPQLQIIGSVPGGFLDDHPAGEDPARSMMESRAWPESTPTGSRGTIPVQLDRSTLRHDHDWQIIDHAESSDLSSPARKRSKASVAGAGARSSWNDRNRDDTTRNTDSPNIRSNTASGASYASPRSKTAISSPALRRLSTSISTSNRLLKSPDRKAPRLSHRPFSSSSFTSSFTFPSSTTTTFPPPPPSSSSSSSSTSTSTAPHRTTLPISPRRSQPSQIATTNLTSPSSYSPEIAASHTRRLKAQSARSDEKLAAMNAQMREMIRIGREALGTRIDVFDHHEQDGDGGCFDEDGMVDEGYAEGFEDDEVMRL